MQLRRQPPPARLISLVSMIDVLLIMLIFFMVTSTYLNLKMIPMAETAAGGAQPLGNSRPMMIRLGADGAPYLRGQQISYQDLSIVLTALPPNASVMILPSLRAETQSLVTLMDVATTAGIRSLRVIQIATQ
jgi:biopolymer transport protein ExbD